jgi:hypothetical protein
MIVTATYAQSKAVEPAGGALAGERPRLIVSTDIGGPDPDDFQSMAHLLLYADVMDLEGLVSSPAGKGRAAQLHECLDAYAKDYPRLKRHSDRYPAPDALRKLVKQGATDPAPAAGFGEPTEGSRWIVQQANAEGNRDDRPLFVAVWGCITDVAQAVHDEPSIKRRLRVYSIASANRRHDPAARDYLYRRHADLWWIEAETTFRGMYQGGRQDGDLGNQTFLAQHVRGHGALGDLLVSKLSTLKMGDTPSILYFLRGRADDPAGPHWGGAFAKTDHGPHYWTDDPRDDLRGEIQRADKLGAKSVNRWREDCLRDWQRRMEPLRTP